MTDWETTNSRKIDNGRSKLLFCWYWAWSVTCVQINEKFSPTKNNENALPSSQTSGVSL